MARIRLSDIEKPDFKVLQINDSLLIIDLNWPSIALFKDPP